MASTDLTITIDALPNPIDIGQDLTITISVCNDGTDDATDVQMVSSIPSVLCLKGIEVEQGTYSFVDREITWEVGDLEADTCKELEYIAVTTEAGPIYLGASVTGTEDDPDLENNSDMTSVTVRPSADLAVYKNVYPTEAKVGEPLTYLVTVINKGPSTATGVTLSEAFSGDIIDLEIDSIESPGSCTPVINEAFTCDLGSLGPHEIAQVTVVVIPGLEGTLLNTVQVTSEVQDPVMINNSDDLFVSVEPVVDLAAVKTASPQIGVLGEEIQFEITVTNNGPSEATGIIVQDTLPSGLTNVSASNSGTISGNMVIWTFPSLPNGSSETLIITGTPDRTGIFTNSVSVTANEADSDPCNNTSITQAFVGSVTGTDLTVTKSHCPDTVKLCKPLTFTIEVTNNGPEVATGVTLYDQIPSSMEIISVNTSQGYCCSPWSGECRNQCQEERGHCYDEHCDDNCCSFEKRKCSPLHEIVCHLGTLAVGASAIVEIVVRPKMKGDFTNTAMVTSNQNELNPSDNQVTDTVTVLRHRCRD